MSSAARLMWTDTPLEWEQLRRILAAGALDVRCASRGCRVLALSCSA
jgi:hypothetical protein